MFPPANAQIYYNEEGEPLGWDIPSDDPPDPDDFYEHPYERDGRWEDDEEEEDEEENG